MFIISYKIKLRRKLCSSAAIKGEGNCVHHQLKKKWRRKLCSLSAKKKEEGNCVHHQLKKKRKIAGNCVQNIFKLHRNKQGFKKNAILIEQDNTIYKFSIDISLSSKGQNKSKLQK